MNTLWIYFYILQSFPWELEVKIAKSHELFRKASDLYCSTDLQKGCIYYSPKILYENAT